LERLEHSLARWPTQSTLVALWCSSNKLEMSSMVFLPVDLGWNPQTIDFWSHPNNQNSLRTCQSSSYGTVSMRVRRFACDAVANIGPVMSRFAAQTAPWNCCFRPTTLCWNSVVQKHSENSLCTLEQAAHIALNFSLVFVKVLFICLHACVSVTWGACHTRVISQWSPIPWEECYSGNSQGRKSELWCHCRHCFSRENVQSKMRKCASMC